MAKKVISDSRNPHNSLDESDSIGNCVYNEIALSGSGQPRPVSGSDVAEKSGLHIELFSVGRSPKQDMFKCTTCARVLPSDEFPLAAITSTSRHRLGHFVLNGSCRSCHASRRDALTDHPLLTQVARRQLTKLVGSASNGARQRGLLCSLTAEDIFLLYVKQDARCALSGIKMVCYETPLKDWNAPSIDRINSKLNYTADNVHLTCWAVNSMKSTMSVAYFRKWCAAVTKHAALTAV